MKFEIIRIQVECTNVQWIIKFEFVEFLCKKMNINSVLADKKMPIKG